MYIIYMISYTCSCNKLVRRLSNKCNRNYKKDNIIYNKSLDHLSTDNCIIHTYNISPVRTYSSTSDSKVLDHPLEDP
jgi:hypothetical protein